MTVLLLFTKVYYNKIDIICTSFVSACQGITRKSLYLAIVAYDITMCVHYGHYLNTVSIRKVVVVNIRTLL